MRSWRSFRSLAIRHRVCRSSCRRFLTSRRFLRCQCQSARLPSPARSLSTTGTAAVGTEGNLSRRLARPKLAQSSAASKTHSFAAALLHPALVVPLGALFFYLDAIKGSGGDAGTSMSDTTSTSLQIGKHAARSVIAGGRAASPLNGLADVARRFRSGRPERRGDAVVACCACAARRYTQGPELPSNVAELEPSFDVASDVPPIMSYTKTW